MSGQEFAGKRKVGHSRSRRYSGAGGGWSPVGVHLEQDGPPPGQAPLLGMRDRILDRKHGHSIHLDSRDVPHPVVESVVGGGALLCTGGNGTGGVHTGEHSRRAPGHRIAAQRQTPAFEPSGAKKAGNTTEKG